MKIEMAITKKDFTAVGEVAARLEARNGGFFDRTMITLYNETGDREAVSDLVRAIREAEQP